MLNQKTERLLPFFHDLLKFGMGAVCLIGLGGLAYALGGAGIPSAVGYIMSRIDTKTMGQLGAGAAVVVGGGLLSKMIVEYFGAGKGWALLIGIAVAILIYGFTVIILQKQYPNTLYEVNRGTTMMLYPIFVTMNAKVSPRL